MKAWLRFFCVAATAPAFGAEAVLMPARGIAAHRGGAATHPENTLPAFAEAVRLGAHRIEFARAISRDARLPGWIAALRTAGVRIHYYHAEDPAEAARLLAPGVDFVLADAVAAVMAGQRGLAPLVPVLP